MKPKVRAAELRGQARDFFSKLRSGVYFDIWRELGFSSNLTIICKLTYLSLYRVILERVR